MSAQSVVHRGAARNAALWTLFRLGVCGWLTYWVTKLNVDASAGLYRERGEDFVAGMSAGIVTGLCAGLGLALVLTRLRWLVEDVIAWKRAPLEASTEPAPVRDWAGIVFCGSCGPAGCLCDWAEAEGRRASAVKP